MRRVVVTGIGMVCPLGCNTEIVWKRLLAGESGITKMPENVKTLLEASGLSNIHAAGIIPRDSMCGVNDFNQEVIFGRNMDKEMSKFIQYAIHASDLALQHANLMDDVSYTNTVREDFGVAISSGGMGSLQEVVDASNSFDTNFKKLSPYFIPKILSNMAAGHVSIRHKLYGPIHSVSTACAAGLHSIGDAFNFIRTGFAEKMLAGGTEGSIDALSIAGFARMKALSTSSDVVNASKPFDSNRDGFVMGEGACVMVLEELSSALKRNAPIIAEVCGYGLSADAHGLTSPSPDGRGAKKCMEMAIRMANIQPCDIGYLNAHATSTPIGDVIEAIAIDSLFSCNTTTTSEIFVSSTKGATGHLLGAAGSIEAAFTVLALRDGLIPPTLNMHSIDFTPRNFAHVPLDSIAYYDRTSKPLRFALKNSFGFGGMNASVVFSAYDN